jgi:hypothetical protein
MKNTRIQRIWCVFVLLSIYLLPLLNDLRLPTPQTPSIIILSERVRVALRLAVYHQSVRLGDKSLEDRDQYCFFQMNTCCHTPYVTTSLTREWVCRLQLLLILASAVILRSESRGTHDHILLSQIRDSPNLEGQVPVFISSRYRVAWLCLQALGSISVAS